MASLGAFLNLQRRPTAGSLRSLLDIEVPVEQEVNILAEAAEEREKQDEAGPSFRPVNPMQSILEEEKFGAFNALQNIPISPLASAVELMSPGAYDAMTAPVEGANPEVPNMLAAMDQMSLGGLIDTPVAAGLLRTKAPQLREMAPARLRGRPAGSVGDLATAEPFYSQARTVLEDPKTQGTQTGEAWGRFLTDPKRGVKTEEMEYTGLGSFLKSKGGQRVTRDEIQSHLDANEIEIKEVTKGTPHEIAWEPDTDYPGEILHGRAPDAAKSRYVVMKERSGPRAGKWIMEDSADSGVTGTFDTQEAAQRAATYALGMERSGQPKFSQYTLPGAENYREVLLQLPKREVKPADQPLGSIEEIRPEDGFPPAYKYKVTVRGRVRPFATRQGAEKELADQQNIGQMIANVRADEQANFTSGHWDEPNVLAHLRLSDRTVNGKKTLLVEEIQSDWAQKGRKEGFALKSEQTAPMDSEYRALVHKNAAAREAGREPDAADVARTQSLEAALLKSDSSKIPQAPFVTDTGKWTMLGLKRVLKMAADEGYDSIGIVPGVEQAKRYDLSKHVDQLSWWKVGDQYGITGYKDGTVLFQKKNLTGNDLADNMGKELADKVNAAVSQDEQSGNFSGLDLKVGGEGMKGYYDKIVPDTLNKLAKEFGVKVQIEGGKVETETTTQESGEEMPYGTDIPIHTLEVPESMKKQIKAKGFPLYSKNSLGGLLGAQNA